MNQQIQLAIASFQLATAYSLVLILISAGAIFVTKSKRYLASNISYALSIITGLLCVGGHVGQISVASSINPTWLTVIPSVYEQTPWVASQLLFWLCATIVRFIELEPD